MRLEFFNACHDKSILVFDLSYECLLMTGSECVGPWRGFKFSVSFRAFSSRRNSLTQTFVESCIDFKVAHLSIFMVRRLQYGRLLRLNNSVKSTQIS